MGYLAHKKHPPSQDPTVGPFPGSYDGPMGGRLFLMSEATLYGGARLLANRGMNQNLNDLTK